MNAYKELATAILIQAYEDYHKLLRGGSFRKENVSLNEIEMFVNSEKAEYYCDVIDRDVNKYRESFKKLKRKYNVTK